MEKKFFFCFIEKHYAQRKAMQKCVSKKSQNRIYNLWNNHSFYMDGSVLPGNKTLTSTLVVLIRPPHPGTKRRIFRI